MPDINTRIRQRRLRVEGGTKHVVERVVKFFDNDITNRSGEMATRLQRYAKFRQWTEDGSDIPWPDSANVAVPDMMTDSLRTQDTLHNAVMSTRPAIQAHAIDKADKKQEESINHLLDYQAFVENGEGWLGDCVDSFVNDGHFTAFVPWVEESQKVTEERTLPPIPAEVLPIEFFQQQLKTDFQGAEIIPQADEGEAPWDFLILPPEEPPVAVHFYVQKENGPTIMLVERQVEVFNGPKIIIKDRSEVLHPVRVANLQPPSPSNPQGSPHVILVDHPTLEEITTLRQTGFYNRLTDSDIEQLKALVETPDSEQDQENEQKDIMEGADPLNTSDVPPQHRTFTRLICFDVMDINGDGIGESVMWWVIKEIKALAKWKRVSEMYPFDRPRRPFAEASFIPVRGRRTGISLLEIMEGLHDTTKELLDLSIDSGTLTVTPFGFYRASGAMRPETIRMYPGDMYPLADPKNDVNFPNLSNNSQALMLNLLTILQQSSDQLTMVGDLQLGGVPKGGASALRTQAGIMTIAGQGEARPERILRRFFSGLTDIWSMMHQMNKRLLPANKRVRVVGLKDQREDPYVDIEKKTMDIPIEFDFTANVFNTAKAQLQQSYLQAMQVSISAIGIQLGLTSPDNIYNLWTDFYDSFGLDPARYVTPPSGLEAILAEEALQEILAGRMPDGVPLEPPELHLQKLMEFASIDENIIILGQEGQQIFAQYVQQVQAFIQQAQVQQQLAEAASQGQGGAQQAGGGGQSQGGVDTSQSQVQPNELMDETLPTAGGGANVG